MTRVSAAQARLAALVRDTARAGRRLLLLGMGNEMLGDDAAGCLVARDLAADAAPWFAAIDVGVGVENAGSSIRRRRADVVLLVDAALGLGRRAWGFVPVERLDSCCHSTHAVPLSLLVAAWRGDAPTLEVHFIGVRPHGNEFGAPLSPAAERARRRIVATVRAARDAGR